LASALRGFVQEQSRRKEWLLSQIDDALRRLEDGSYGVCWECDSQIPDAWLASVPYAARCARCDSQQVLSERIY
jgi:DnaK suppressor protein